MNLPHVYRRIVMNNVHITISDVSVRRGVVRCLISLGKSFSEHEGRVCISDLTDVRHEPENSVPVLLVTDKDVVINGQCVVLPKRFPLLRKEIQKFLTDNSI